MFLPTSCCWFLQYVAAYAEVDLLPVGGSGVRGALRVMQYCGKDLYVVGDISGLQPGVHEAQVRWNGDCKANLAGQVCIHKIYFINNNSIYT